MQIVDVAIITIAVIVIHVWRTMMEEIYRCQHLFTENDLDVAIGTMRWMPYKEVTGILTDIGTEELAHMEMICAIVYQLTKDLSPEEIKASGFDKYYVDHTLALWPQAASGTPWTATYFQSKGDPITDLHEDMAADGTIV